MGVRIPRGAPLVDPRLRLGVDVVFRPVRGAQGPASPAATRADRVFVVPFRVWLYSNAAAPYVLLNAIFSALFLRFGDRVPERLEKLEQIYNQLETFTDE